MTAVLHIRLRQNNVLLVPWVPLNITGSWRIFHKKLQCFLTEKRQLSVMNKHLCPALNPQCRGAGLCSQHCSHSPFPRPREKLLPSPVWIRPLSLSSFVQSCLSSHIVLLQSETPSQQLPLSITLPGSPDYQEENWSEHLPVLINCVAQVI